MIKLGLIGCPLGHSLSPKIHKAALKACGLQGNYALFPISPDDLDELKALLERVRCGEITGLNVTIPHKQNIIPLLNEISTTAVAVGAVNTIFMRGGKLIGENTDVPGFLKDLKRFIGNRKSKINKRQSALILGAGGSARAVVYALIQDGWQVTIAARRSKQVQELITQLQNPDSLITSIERTALNSIFPTLIVNTTPVGMSPNVHTSPWPSGQPIPKNTAIFDLVYNPCETKLVKDARAAGLSATTGLGMLIEQAALSFEIWTGCSVPREPLFSVVEAS